jgi:hypothetical protein
MAQWLGQYTGKTHATRVADAEVALRRAADVLCEELTADERLQKALAVRGLAERVVALRLRMIRARIVALCADDRFDTGGRSSDWETARDMPRRGPAESISSLRAREELVREGGVEMVLREFGVEDVLSFERR